MRIFTMLFVAMMISFPAHAENVYRYNHMTEEFELAGENEVVQYNGVENSWEYAPEDDIPETEGE